MKKTKKTPPGIDGTQDLKKRMKDPTFAAAFERRLMELELVMRISPDEFNRAMRLRVLQEQVERDILVCAKMYYSQITALEAADVDEAIVAVGDRVLKALLHEVETWHRLQPQKKTKRDVVKR